MLSLRNQVTIVGNIGNPAQITTYENGSKVARFSVGIQRKRKSDKNQPGLESDWYRMFAWGNTAEFVQRYCDKGNKVAITGRLVSRTYISPGGSPQKITEIEVRQVIRL